MRVLSKGREWRNDSPPVMKRQIALQKLAQRCKSTPHIDASVGPKRSLQKQKSGLTTLKGRLGQKLDEELQKGDEEIDRGTGVGFGSRETFEI